MAEELLEEKSENTLQETVEAPPANPEQTEPSSPDKPKKERELLRPFLIFLLIVLGIAEAVFWGCFGLASYRNSLAVERYEEQQRMLEEERASRGVVGGSAYGPNLKVENGTVTWEREKWISVGSNTTGNTTPAPRRADGLRLSRLSVFRIPYVLAQMEEDWSAPKQIPAPTDGETAPTNT